MLSAEQMRKTLPRGEMGRFWPAADRNVLPGDQYELYLARRFNDTPVLIGTNSDEGALFMRPGITAPAFERQIRSGYGAKADVILAAYPHGTDAEAFRSAKEVFRESAFAWHTWVWAKLQSERGKGKAFVYYFDHRTPKSPDGANHGAELPYVFGNFGGLFGEPRLEDMAMSDLVRSYWINFAKTGDPNGAGLPKWPAFSEKAQNAMFFDNAPGARPLPNMDKLKALDEYYAWRRVEAKAVAAALKQPVKVMGGQISGIPGKDPSVLVFKGVPYAAPPVGELRWRAPQPVVAWQGVRKGDSFGAACMQNIVTERKPWTYEFMTHGGISEDCLFLNVWTAARAATEKRPVFIFIHGGGFSEGSGHVPVYDGEGLARKGIVYVSVNYRLGVGAFSLIRNCRRKAVTERRAITDCST